MTGVQTCALPIYTPIAFLSPAGCLIALIDPLDSVSAEVRRSQIRKLDRADVCLELAHALVSAKIANQRTLLLRNHGSLPAGAAADLAKEAMNAARSESLDAVRGHEGQYIRSWLAASIVASMLVSVSCLEISLLTFGGSTVERSLP